MRDLFIVPLIVMAFPAEAQVNRIVDIDQIGSFSSVEVRQTAASASAGIRQTADRSSIAVQQSGDGSALLALVQAGRDGHIDVRQDSVMPLYAASSPENGALRRVTDTANVAMIAQQGDGNSMALTQTGETNSASLVQTGIGNRMTATQTGSGNVLSWTQDGNYLSDLKITQTGAQTASVMQTGGR